MSQSLARMKCLSLIVAITVGVAVLLSPKLQAAPLTLTQGGQALFEIVLPAEASPSERFAAQELQEAFALAAGATPDVVEHDAPEKNLIRVFVGTPENQPEIRLRGLKADDTHDHLLVDVIENSIYLGGSNPRSVLYAAYRFLEETHQFLWLWPGETGVFYQKNHETKLEPMTLRETASLPLRSLSINNPHYEPDTVLWMARNKLNNFNAAWNIKPFQVENLKEKGFVINHLSHDMTLPREVLEENPDFVALYGGSRTLNPRQHTHLCWSNQRVQELLAERLKGKIDEFPDIDLWTLLPVDSTNFCQCEACEQMATDISTRFQKLSAAVIQDVRKTKPKARFVALAYQSYRSVPNEVAPFEYVGYCTYNVSYRNSLKSGATANQTFLEEMKAWQNLGVKMGIRGYEMIPFREKLFVPLVRYEIESIAYCYENNIGYFSTEVTPMGVPAGVAQEKNNWVTNRLNLYAIGQALWNHRVTPEGVVDRWTKAIYGEQAGEAMARYYHLMERAWLSAPGEVSYFGVPATAQALGMLSDTVIGEAKAAFSDARSHLMKSESPASARAISQVALEEKMFAVWEDIYQTAREDADHFSAVAVKTESADEEIMDPDSDCWKEQPHFPAFRSSRPTPVTDQTDVSALWKDGVLYLRVICHEAAPENRIARFIQRDEAVHQDDSIEIFLNQQEGPGYYHLAFNALGTLYDAFSSAGMNLENQSNPNWSVRVKQGKERWSAVAALPLKEFAYPSDAESVTLSIKRTRPASHGAAYPNSGWPDAAYHSPVNGGTIRLISGAPLQVMIYSSGRDDHRLTTILSKFRRKGWGVRQLAEADGTLAEPKSHEFVFIRHSASPGAKPLPYSYINSVLLPWLSSGGVMLISCSHSLHLEKWFPGEGIRVEWGGWGAPARRSDWIAEGKWNSTPNDLNRSLRGRTTPAAGYRPLEGEWEVLATQPMRDGESAAFLMSARVGEGYLFVTTSDMGFGSGFEMFGDLSPDSVVSLIENLSFSTN